MQQVKSFDDYSPWVDSMETKSQLDKIAFLSVVILHTKYQQRYNNYIYLLDILITSKYIRYISLLSRTV